MGNSSSNNNLKTIAEEEDDEKFDDFEPIDKPASPTFTLSSALGMGGGSGSSNTSTSGNNSPNDLATSGILVDMSDDEKAMIGKRRIVKASTKDATKGKIGGATAASTGSKGDVKASATTISSGAPSTGAVPGGNSNEDDEEKRHHEYPVTALGKSQHSDTELLRESLEKDRELRFHKLQTDQKSKRSKAVEERRKNTSSSAASNVAQPNPFSRFLSVFSVEPQFPSHKRRYEASENEWQEDEVQDTGNTASSQPTESVGRSGTTGEPKKRPKLGPSAAEDNKNAADAAAASSSNSPFFSIHSWSSTVLGWFDSHLPTGWSWMTAAAAATTTTAVVALVVMSATRKSSSRAANDGWFPTN